MSVFCSKGSPFRVSPCAVPPATPLRDDDVLVIMVRVRMGWNKIRNNSYTTQIPTSRTRMPATNERNDPISSPSPDPAEILQEKEKKPCVLESYWSTACLALVFQHKQATPARVTSASMISVSVIPPHHPAQSRSHPSSHLEPSVMFLSCV